MKKTIVFPLICLLCAGQRAPLTDALASVIPSTSIAVVRMKSLQTDPGIQWLLAKWKNRDTEHQSKLVNLFKTRQVTDFDIGVFPPKGNHSVCLLLSCRISNPAQIPLDVLDTIIKTEEASTITRSVYKEIKIHSVEDSDDEFRAYAVFENTVLIASDTELIKSSIDGSTIASTSHYLKAAEQLGEGGEGLFFADNENAKFVNFLRPLEEKWKMTFFLSSEYFLWLGSVFDVVNSDEIKGKIVFRGSDGGHIDEIRDDAEFLGETIRRKFAADSIVYTGSVEVEGSTVSLHFRLEGMESLWNKVFQQGLMSLIRPI